MCVCTKCRRIFVCSPCKLTQASACELQMPHLTMHQVLRKCLCLYACKLQVVQATMPDDRVAHKEFAVTTLEKLEEGNKFLMKIMFCDKTTFHISGKANRTCAYGDQNYFLQQESRTQAQWSNLDGFHIKHFEVVTDRIKVMLTFDIAHLILS